MRLVLSPATLLLCALFAGVPSPPAAAQAAPAPGLASPARPATPAARPSDVSSMEAVIGAVYATISGAADQPRDWDRLRSLFVPGARMVAVHSGKDGPNVARVLSVEDYIRLAAPLMAKKGFFERESHRTVDRFGDIAQVFSTYESRYAEADAQPFERGINSFQLMFDGRRWWVVTIYWQGETPDRPIPERYGG